MTNQVFTSIYPDIDPTKGLPLTRGERLAQCCALALFSYGFIRGDLILAGGGLLLLLIAAVAPGRKTARRIRAEARARFPTQPWVETRGRSRAVLALLLILTWVLIVGLNIAAYRYAPEDYNLHAAIGAAILSALLLGLSPIWRRTSVD